MPSMDDEKWKDDMLAALKTIKGKMGYVRTLAKDELEKAKFDIGLNKKISKRMAKRETKRQQKKMNEKDRSILALKKFINKQLNVFINNRFTIHFDGMCLKVLDTSTQKEHKFILIDSTPLFSPYGMMAKWLDVFKAEDRFGRQVNIKDIVMRQGYFGSTNLFSDEANGYGRAEYNLAEGGFVDVPEATYRKYDMIPALLCRNEFVFTQEACRGAGRGSYIEGGYFLSLLMDHYEKEAKRYEHRR
jgi:hypothetical protein